MLWSGGGRERSRDAADRSVLSSTGFQTGEHFAQ